MILATISSIYSKECALLQIETKHAVLEVEAVGVERARLRDQIETIIQISAIRMTIGEEDRNRKTILTRQAALYSNRPRVTQTLSTPTQVVRERTLVQQVHSQAVQSNKVG